YHFSPLFGNCYTFNPAYLNHSNAVAQGFLEGLDVQFFIHQDQYLYPGTQGAGVSVTVHKADIYPMPEVNGVFAQPGTHTLIEYKRKNIKRIKSPHGKCRTTPLKYSVPSAKARREMSEIFGFEFLTETGEKPDFHQTGFSEGVARRWMEPTSSR
ncbi:unnamed protein product, partial [Didymodactylos carnosus]